ncbi:MAG: hypothetical protein ISR69_00905 [Gammaproteobacteria bacterium]|nr:hypothetical protein [Gammaproteobacteria bacterium]
MKLIINLSNIFVLLIIFTSTVSANEIRKGSPQHLIHNSEPLYGFSNEINLGRSSYLTAELNNSGIDMTAKQSLNKKDESSSNIFIKAIGVGALLIALTTDESSIKTGSALLGVTLLVVDF